MTDIRIKRLFGTSWCSDCKRTKAFLGDHRIDFEWVDIEKNEEAAKFVEKINDGKRRVPTIEFSDGTYLSVPSNAELAEKLGLKSKIDHDFHQVIIIGGGPTGLTCALYTSREGLDTLVVEKSALGGQMGYTERIDNYPGFPNGISGNELAKRFVKQAERFSVEFLKATEIVDVYKKNQYVEVKSSSGYVLCGKTVVVCTGSEYRMLNVPGEKDLIGYKIHFCATCDGPFYKNKEVIVIGGGNSAFEESLFLARFASKVKIVGRDDNWSASSVLQQKVSETQEIETIPFYETKEFIAGPDKTLRGVIFKDTKNEKEVTLKPEGVFVFIGMKPNVKIVEGLVETDESGFILTDETMMTKTPGLFAAGDCRKGSTQQVASAAGEGVAVALHIRDYINKH